MKLIVNQAVIYGAVSVFSFETAEAGTGNRLNSAQSMVKFFSSVKKGK